MKKSPKLIAKMLRQLAKQIEEGSCGLDDEELMEMGMLIAHRKMNIEQICQYFGKTRITINRWQQCGKLPQFRKDSGGKDYLWLDEIEMSIQKWNEEHPES